MLLGLGGEEKDLEHNAEVSPRGGREGDKQSIRGNWIAAWAQFRRTGPLASYPIEVM